MRLRVHAKVAQGAKFRRNGEVFTAEPRVIDAAALGWSEAQIAALKGTPILHVEDLDAADQVQAAAKSAAPKTTRG